ncbi:hypothetical protein KI387_028949, partial [Taxus chinensis]
MQTWLIVLAAGLPAAIAMACIIFITLNRHSGLKLNLQEALGGARGNSSEGRKTLREIYMDPNQKHCRLASMWRKSYSYSRRYPLQAFSWNNHPSLISEAVEHGWFTFGFTKTCVPSFSNKIWGLCNRASYTEGVEPEISWETGSRVNCFQKIRLNPGLSTKKNMNLLLPVQSVQTALPLPGPLTFPQVAYFEITILAEEGEQVCSSGSSKKFAEDDNSKLLRQPSNSEDHFKSCEMTSTAFNPDYMGDIAVKGLRSSIKDTYFPFSGMDPAGIPKVISLGLAVSGTAIYRLPGCERGSVGFHSTGLVFLNGMAHLDADKQEDKSASKTRAWSGVNTVIGCGFDPENKSVFYTLNGEQVYSLTCHSDEFSNPLYPTIAANYDVTVLVNLGQSLFNYLPSNEKR